MKTTLALIAMLLAGCCNTHDSSTDYGPPQDSIYRKMIKAKALEEAK